MGLTMIARSGQCVSHQWQAVQFSGLTTMGWSSSPNANTPDGQNSTQIPQPLHHIPKITTFPRGMRFLGWEFTVTGSLSLSSTGLSDIYLYSILRTGASENLENLP
jgi:hypothetical protein